MTLEELIMEQLRMGKPEDPNIIEMELVDGTYVPVLENVTQQVKDLIVKED